MNAQIRSPSQLFILARNQAFFKVQFFGDDRAGDLGREKTKEILYWKKGLLFNHTLTNSLRNGTSNLFALKRHETHLYARLLQWRSTLFCATYWRSLFDENSCLGPWTHRERLFRSAAAQARLSMYTSQITVFSNRNVTLHGLLRGCAISLQSLEKRLMQSWITWLGSLCPLDVTMLNWIKCFTRSTISCMVLLKQSSRINCFLIAIRANSCFKGFWRWDRVGEINLVKRQINQNFDNSALAV